jgi:hypothetical protein
MGLLTQTAPAATILDIQFSKDKMSEHYEMKSDTEIEKTGYAVAVTQGTTMFSSDFFKGPVQIEAETEGWFYLGLCPEVSDFNKSCTRNENAFM